MAGLSTDPFNITVLGAGNVGHQMALAAFRAGIGVDQVFSRDRVKAGSTAALVNAEAIDSLENIKNSSDLYVIALSDDAIEGLGSILKLPGKIAVHTSGATSIHALDNITGNNGVIWPVYSINRSMEENFERIPLCITASNEETAKIIHRFSNWISSHVIELDDEKRRLLHLTAVIANNFTNHLGSMISEIADHHNLPVNILNGLRDQTFGQLKQNDPRMIQTGPAKRGDWGTVLQHLEYLKDTPNFKQVYESISQSIREFHNPENGSE